MPDPKKPLQKKPITVRVLTANPLTWHGSHTAAQTTVKETHFGRKAPGLPKYPATPVFANSLKYYLSGGFIASLSLFAVTETNLDDCPVLHWGTRRLSGVK